MSYDRKQWWEEAIARNRAALLRIVLTLWVKAGLDEGGAESLPHASWRAILAILCPAESAVRRLIVIVARDLVVRLRERAAAKRAGSPFAPLAGRRWPAGPDEGPAMPQASVPADAAAKTGIELPNSITAWVAPPAKPKTGRKGKYTLMKEPFPLKGSASRPSFVLFDAPIGNEFAAPGRRSGKWVPRIRSLSEPYRPEPEPEPAEDPFPDGEVGAAGLCRRIVALRAALEDLPRHALRFARKRARRDHAEATLLAACDPFDEAHRRATNRFCFTPAYRIGRPPGRRKRGKRPIDEILSECHDLALATRPGFRRDLGAQGDPAATSHRRGA